MRACYSPDEVQALVEFYPHLLQLRDTSRQRLRFLIACADLSRAIPTLPVTLRDVVFLHGLLGLEQEGAGQILSISRQAVGKRYRQAIEHLTLTMNGGPF